MQKTFEMEVEETKESSDFECRIESVPSCANSAAELAKWVVSSSSGYYS